jgi:hypothetical protein
MSQRLLTISEDIEKQNNLEMTHKYGLIEIKNAVQEALIQITDNKVALESLLIENDKLRMVNNKLEIDSSELRYKLDELKQKVELNSILKDIDVEELKLLSQNNAMVNNSISNLVTKWDQAYSRLKELEKFKE